ARADTAETTAPVPDAPVPDATSTPGELMHAAGPYELPVGGEFDDCESWTLHNREPIYVQDVTFEASEGMHHSNWFFVPEGYYAGPDGRWTCRDRGFDTGVSGLVGGVVFAQSTQATHEVQHFPSGAALVIPPRSRIVGNVHALNLTSGSLGVRFA